MPERHHEVTRLEGFSDAVFGFALTLLVVSLDVPSDIDKLKELLRGLPAFGLMFAMVCWIWYEHNHFFRNYGLQDQWTVFLNSVLLFVVLFYVYPLKYLTMAILKAFFGIGPADGPHFTSEGDGAFLMWLYSSGVVLIFGTFVLMYLHAWKQRESLGLTPEGTLDLKFSMRHHLASMSLGFVSMAVLAVSSRYALFAGVLYALMGPLHGVTGYFGGKARDELRKTMANAQR